MGKLEDEVEAYVGHAPGGVCPFGVNEGVAVYLDESLRKFDTVYPAAGNGHTAVKLTLQELEAAAGAEDWGGCLQGAGRRIRYHKINAKGVLPGPSSMTELPFLLHKSQCEGLPGSRKKTFIALPAATLSGAKTTRPAESQEKSDWTG